MLVKKLSLPLILALGLNLSANSEYEKFLQEYKKEYSSFVKDHKTEYKNYKKAYEEAFLNYSSNIEKKWPNLDITNRHNWVQYDKDYNSKKKVDFENKELSIEVIAKNEKDAKEKILELTKNIAKDTVKTAYKNDQLQQDINKKLNTKPEVKKDEKIISDLISKKDLLKKVQDSKIKKIKHKDKFIYSVNVKLPSNSLIKKAKAYKSEVMKNSLKRDIPPQLVYAIMHSESSFNPMARSHVPAYGLMQIVPRTAGVDTYNFLYGKKKLLSPSYLYDSSNNIKMGTAYLHIVYFRYMKRIKNPISRMYCTIAAYNTGAGNVAKAFIGNYNIYKASKKINTMTPSEVYNHLYKNLPYVETKKYLKKVNTRVSIYKKLLDTKL